MIKLKITTLEETAKSRPADYFRKSWQQAMLRPAFYGCQMTFTQNSESALAAKARARLSQLPGHGLPCANPAPTRRIMRSAVSFIKAAASVSGAQIQLTMSAWVMA